MLKKITILLFIIISFLIISCQEVFTYSALEGLQRDPSSLSDEQKITYGYDALATGDPSTIREAYDAVSAIAGPGSSDEINLLAFELGMAAAGSQKAVEDSLDAFLDSGDNTILADLGTALGTIDRTLLSDSLGFFLEAGDASSDTNKLNAAVALVIVASQAYGDDLSLIDFDLNNDLTVDTADVPTVDPGTANISSVDLTSDADVQLNQDFVVEYAFWLASQADVDDIYKYFN